MAEIFLAVQSGPFGFEKTVVIKRILSDLCASDDFVQMFLDEARLAARLDHTNVVRVYDLGEVAGSYFIAMEYIAGEDLASVLQQCKRRKVPVPVDLAADVGIGVADGLHYAHEMRGPTGEPLNIVHRDVSPSNVIVSYHGAAKVVDFGIARAQSNVSKTAAGTVKGKLQYMSPEYARADAIDRRADLFSLGLVMHELLTQQRLFRRETDMGTLKALLEDAILPPSHWRSDLPAEIDRIVMKALDRDVNARYQTGAEISADLGGFLIGRGYARSGVKVADFFTGLFGPERRTAKEQIAHGAAPGPGDPAIKTPSAWKLASGDFAAVRSLPDAVPRLTTPSTAPGAPSAPDFAGLLDLEPPTRPRLDSEAVQARVAHPDAGALPAPAAPARPSARTPRRSPRVALGVGGLVIAVGVVTLVAALRRAPPAPRPPGSGAAAAPSPTPPPAPVPAGAKAATPSPAAAPGGGSAALPGGLLLEGVPSGARVRVDGELVKNPTTVQWIAPRKHRVVVDAKGFLRFESMVELKAGEIYTLTVELTPAPVERRGTVEISCIPWCQISVDGQDTGETSPAKLSLSPGPHGLLLANPPLGLAKMITVNVTEGRTVKQVVNLEE